MVTHTAVCPVLVGREAELAALEAAAEQRATTLIGGQAGVGKSRLSNEAVRLAHDLGMSSLIGHCLPQTTVPYAPFVTAIRRRTRTLEPAELTRLFDGAALLSAALLPEVAATVHLPDSAPAQEDLFAAIWQLLYRLAGGSGSLLLLEDIHWADSDSLRLLSYLAGEMTDLSIWLVATYRTDELHRRHPLTATLAELARERRYQEIVLSPFGREEIRQMVSAIFEDTDVGDEFVDAVADRTAGNPFFVEELVKVLIERGDIYRGATDWERRELAEIEMPLTVRETLLARAKTLDDSHLRAFQLAALAGERLDPAVIARAAELDAAGVEDLVLEGLRLQLLTERRDGQRVVYAFRHALTREAFADDLVGPDRQRAHRQIADAIAHVHSADLDSVAAELADHYAEAGDAALAVEFGERAADRAAASFSLDEAGRRYEQTLRMMPADSSHRLPMLLRAGEALVDARDRRLAVAFATEARALAIAAGDVVAESKVLDVLSRDAWNSGDTARTLALDREALDLVQGRDDTQEALVLAHLTRMLSLADRVPEAAAMLPAGIELATRAKNNKALSSMYGTMMMHEGYGPRFEELFQKALEASRIARDESSERNLATNAGYMSMWCGYFDYSGQAISRAVELSERITPHDRYAQAGYAWLLSLEGRHAEAAAIAGESRTSGHIPTKIVALTALYEISERRGEADAGEMAEDLWSIALGVGEAQRSVPAAAARARHALIAGGVEQAGPLFWEVLGHTTTNRGTGSHWMFSPDFARALADQEEAEELERWATEIRALTESDPHPHNQAAGALVDAHLAARRGELVAARGGFVEAARLYGQMPCPARESEALIGLADLEWRAGQPEDSADAARRATEIAERIGALAVGERAADAVARAEVTPVLATVMFTDIVSSTERLSEVGDRAWRALLDRHNSLVRRELGRWNGREIDTTGDGFLATFESPAQGIRCALAVRDALAAAGIQIRAGLHTGECQITGGNIAGIAVHIAARVSAAAGAGEVLVSSTVRELVAGSAFRFSDRGLQTLKGVPGEWRLFAAAV